MNEKPDLTELRARHAALEREVDDESSRPLPDQTRLTALKREKLKIKDEIARVTRDPAAA